MVIGVNLPVLTAAGIADSLAVAGSRTAGAAFGLHALGAAVHRAPARVGAVSVGAPGAPCVPGLCLREDIAAGADHRRGAVAVVAAAVGGRSVGDGAAAVLADVPVVAVIPVPVSGEVVLLGRDDDHIAVIHAVYRRCAVAVVRRRRVSVVNGYGHAEAVFRLIRDRDLLRALRRGQDELPVLVQRHLLAVYGNGVHIVLVDGHRLGLAVDGAFLNAYDPGDRGIQHHAVRGDIADVVSPVGQSGIDDVFPVGIDGEGAGVFRKGFPGQRM